MPQEQSVRHIWIGCIELHMTYQMLKEILYRFRIDSEPVSCDSIGEGHIHQTYRIETADGEKYTLQKINDYVFRNLEGLMQNVVSVCEFLTGKADDSRFALRFIRARDDSCFISYGETFWRMYRYIDRVVCPKEPYDSNDLYEIAYGFGKFQYWLSGFPVDSLCETIPNFHNTSERIRFFSTVLKEDRCNRAAFVKKEIRFVLDRQNEMETLQSMRNNDVLPVRVTHNDTKLNNVLLDEKTRKVVSVIDLDTVMPGLGCYDFGDCIRTGAVSVKEDDKELSNVYLDLDKYRSILNGFTDACTDMNMLERSILPMGAKTITFETGLRFLTDFLMGDVYFPVDYEEHNLVRCRNQFALVSDMEKKWDQMRSISSK